MKYKQFKDTYAVRLDIEEEVVESLLNLFEKENITSATITGIGACDDVELATYRLAEKKYYTENFKQDMEMTNLMGNVTKTNDGLYLHLHATFSDEKMQVIGGHLNKAVISIVGEIFVTVIAGEIVKKLEKDKGIWAFDF